MSRIDFDTALYDPDADVLYLSIGDPERAVAFEESPEGSDRAAMPGRRARPSR